jgi:hypothetical protein
MGNRSYGSCGDRTYAREELLMVERDDGRGHGGSPCPAAQFVKTAKQFASQITVTKGEREANISLPNYKRA